MTRSLAVVKVGGSLYGLGDLGPRLRQWLDQAPVDDVLLVPGGGPLADVVHALDIAHRLGEEKAHWLALRALTLNAHFLADLLPKARVIERVEDGFRVRQEGLLPVLDPQAFLRDDERTHADACLPHLWSVTSDSVAARVAVAAGAALLVLLKSVTIPADLDWDEAARRGWVDEWFGRTVRQGGNGLRVRSVNLRTWEG